MKIIFFTDIHARETVPSCRKDENFLNTIQNKLDQIFNIAKDCDLILIGGDIFNKPEESCLTISTLIDVFKPYKDKLYTVIGNHDIYGYSKEGFEGTALELLVKAGVINILNILEYDNVLIYGVHAYDKEIKLYRSLKHKITIAVLHKMLSVNGEFNSIKISEIDHDNAPHIVLSGDIHIPHELKLGDRIYLNPGSLTRQNINERDFNPKIYCIDIDQNYHISYKSFPLIVDKDVFKMDEYIEKKKREELIKFTENYAKQIKTIKNQSIDIKQQLISYLGQIRAEEPVKNLVMQYFKMNENQLES